MRELVARLRELPAMRERVSEVQGERREVRRNDRPTRATSRA